MLEFKVAANRAVETDDDFVPIRLVDPNVPETDPEEKRVRTLKAFRPNDTQFALLMASSGRGQPNSERIAGYINFFVNIFDTDDADYLSQRLLDRRDEFSIEHVEQILEGLTEEWSGHPTQPSSASTPSPPSTGPSSTLPPPPPT